jgi:2,3-dihydroxybenzoate decarboxylase
MMIIDFHIHFSPEEDVRAQLRQGGETQVTYRDGIPTYTHHDGLHQLDRHLECMDGAGVEVAVLSSAPGMVGDLKTCVRVNDRLAKAEQDYPGRLRGLAHAPAFGGKAALDELTRCHDELGFPGVVLTSTIAGRSLDDPDLDPYWERVQELGMFAFVHPALGEPATGLQAYQDYDLYRCVGREFDLILATARLIFGGVFDRFPGLQVVMSHLGGGIGPILDRIRGYQDKSLMGVADDPRHGRTADKPIDHYLENALFFDTGGFFGSVPAVAAGLITLPQDRIVFGSDYPQEIRSPEEFARFTRELREMDAPPAVVEGIFSENARHLIGQ